MSFLPLPSGGYLLATNRDESPRRGEAAPPSVREIDGREVLAPTDADAGGTWIAADAAGACLCILNGDRPPAVPPADDAPSRGVLVMELMRRPALADVGAELERRRAAGSLREKAFKLLVVEPGPAGARLGWIEWDGRALRTTEHERPTLAVSSTFEADDVEATRGAAFGELAEAAARLGADELAERQLAWHAGRRAEAPEGDAWCVCMHRPDARSVSLTQVRFDAGRLEMGYVAGQPCAGASPQRSALGRAG